MANNKVALSDGTVLIDLSSDTVKDASHIVSGYVGHLADGSTVTGTGGGGGGINGFTELYSNDAVSITYTSTSAGTAKSITGITGIATYPFIIVDIENTNNPNTASSLKFRRSCTVIANNNFASGSVSVVRYGSMQYYNSSSTATQTASTSYGLWGYTISTSSGGTLTIRGRCNSGYFTSLTGTYKVRVIGVKL